MIDTAHAVIVDVEATPARMAQEIVAAKTMLDRVAEAHDMEPDFLAADKGYGTGPFWRGCRNAMSRPISRFWTGSARARVYYPARPSLSIRNARA
jgi:hypothetical protein